MDEKQTQALKCLDGLTAYATQHRLSMRIIDELEDCKQQIASPDVDWTAVNLAMEGVLNSVEHKTAPDNAAAEHDDKAVSVEMVKEQIAKMAKRCQADNTTSIDSMAERTAIIVKKNCEQMMDISRTEAHIEEFKNEALYLQFFQNCKTVYERDAFEMFRELLQSVSGNYNHMLNHMKSMFQNIGGYQSGIGSEKFYYEYEERRTGIDRKIQGEVQTADIGGSDIVSFGQKTKESVKGIVRKLTRKRRLLKWLPLLILLCFIVSGAAGKMTEKQNDTKQAAAEAESDDSFIKDTAMGFVENILENNKGSDLMQMVENAANGIASALVSLAAVLALIVFVLVLLYILYLKALNKWCDRQIARRCGEYLKTELIQFEQTNALPAKLKAAMKNAAEEYEQQYMNVLNNLFQDLQGNKECGQPEENAAFMSLRNEWECVRKM